MKKTFLATAIAALAIAMASPMALAGTSTGTMAVSATVGNVCDVTGTPPTAMAFGTITSALTAPVDAVATITVNCNAAMPFTVGLQSVNIPGGDAIGALKLSAGGNLLGYSLFSDSAYSVKWGNTTGTDTVSGNGVVGTPQVLKAYGQINAGFAAPTGSQNPLVPVPGTYADTVNVTVSY